MKSTTALPALLEPGHRLIRVAEGRIDNSNLRGIRIGATRTLLQIAQKLLPVRFREILVLRELEGLSYEEIADVMSVPMGTVMSTLSRARDRFRQTAGNLRNTYLSSEADSAVTKGRECAAAGACE